MAKLKKSAYAKYTRGKKHKFSDSASRIPMECKEENCHRTGMVDLDTEFYLCWWHTQAACIKMTADEMSKIETEKEKKKAAKSLNRSEGLKKAWERRRVNGTTTRKPKITKEQFRDKV